MSYSRALVTVVDQTSDSLASARVEIGMSVAARAAPAANIEAALLCASREAMGHADLRVLGVITKRDRDAVHRHPRAGGVLGDPDQLLANLDVGAMGRHGERQRGGEPAFAGRRLVDGEVVPLEERGRPAHAAGVSGGAGENQRSQAENRKPG